MCLDSDRLVEAGVPFFYFNGIVWVEGFGEEGSEFVLL